MTAITTNMRYWKVQVYRAGDVIDTFHFTSKQLVMESIRITYGSPPKEAIEIIEGDYVIQVKRDGELDINAEFQHDTFTVHNIAQHL